MTLRPIGLAGPAFPTIFVEASTCLRAQNSHHFLRFATTTTTRQPPQRRFAGTLNSNHSRPCAQLRCLSKGLFLSNGAGGSQLSDNDGAILSPRRIAWLQRNNAALTPHSQRRHLFFSSSHRQNASIDKGDELPHRRRRNSNANQAGEDGEIRPDASSRLSTFSSTLPQTSLKRRLAAYLALTKPHLSFLVVLTATTAYGLYPTPSVLELVPSSTQLPTLSTSTLTFLYLSAGTFLASASANTLNMLFEPKYDACMSRTRNRPLVRGLMSKRAALLFAILTGVAGVTALDLGVNPTVAALGAFNLGLYAFVYTPVKRISVLNTWVGAIVGGIPPLMGWTAAAGQLATIGHDGWQDLLFGPGSAGGWLLAAILYAWQFPHFNSLSHNIKDEYKRAGYRMLAWSNPAMNGRVALRYSILMFPLCAGLWYVGVVDRGFLVIGTAINAWMTREAYRFWKLQGAKASARGLFWASIWHLPILMVGCLVAKKGLWDGVYASLMRLFGYEDEDDVEEYIDAILDEEEEERIAT